MRLLDAQYVFSERVYYHHAKVAAGALVARAVELCVRAGVLAEEDLYDCTDDSLMETLLRAGASGDRPSALRSPISSSASASGASEKRLRVPRYENSDVQDALVERFFASGGAVRPGGGRGAHRWLVRFATGTEVDVIICPAKRMQAQGGQDPRAVAGHASRSSPWLPMPGRVPRLADLSRVRTATFWKFYVLADTQRSGRPAQGAGGRHRRGSATRRNLHSIPERGR